MSNVISLNEARVRTASAVDFISKAYTCLREHEGFVARRGQVDLSRAVCRAFIAQEPLAAEAPTGTGKTIAYLIGALAAAHALADKKVFPVVVATATVGLQQQILSGDLPRLVAAGILGAHEAVIAKGRGRYFCTLAGMRIAEESAYSSQFDLLQPERNDSIASARDVQELLDAQHSGQWDGDHDTWAGGRLRAWKEVAASADTCLGRRCEFFEQCAFFKARARLAHARIIVANQNLVLSDLMMSKLEREPLFPTDHYLCVFDEAHNLPDKALEAGSAALDLTQSQAALATLPGAWTVLARHMDLIRLLDRQGICDGSFDPTPLLAALKACADIVDGLPVDEDTGQLRFVAGEVDPELVCAARLALDQAQALAKVLEAATNALRGSSLGERGGAIAGTLSQALYLLAGFTGRVKDVVRAFELFLAERRAVRWVFHKGEVRSVHVSPLEGADVLRDVLWNQERARVAMVSATLRDFDGFRRFADRAGTPETLRTMCLGHIFPYRECELRVVAMEHSPRFETRQHYERELLEALPESIDPREGTLVLFPSVRLLRLLEPALRRRFGEQLFVQGQSGIRELIDAYRKERQAGRGAVLCGMATMAEGLDLPGDLCTHVIICALPFTAPTSPVEQELAEQMGRGRYFWRRALPDVLVRLTQMTGRLMRTPADRGRITVFDNRLSATRWGRTLLSSLPPFRQRVLSRAQLSTPAGAAATLVEAPRSPPGGWDPHAGDALAALPELEVPALQHAG